MTVDVPEEYAGGRIVTAEEASIIDELHARWNRLASAAASMVRRFTTREMRPGWYVQTMRGRVEVTVRRSGEVVTVMRRGSTSVEDRWTADEACAVAEMLARAAELSDTERRDASRECRR